MLLATFTDARLLLNLQKCHPRTPRLLSALEGGAHSGQSMIEAVHTVHGAPAMQSQASSIPSHHRASI
jgi:hypothetical protein